MEPGSAKWIGSRYNFPMKPRQGEPWGVSGLLSRFKLIVVKFVLADTESFELVNDRFVAE